MDKLKKVDRKTKSKVVPYLLLILIATLIMGIGYASISAISLDIEGTAIAKAQEKVFITDVTFKESTGGLESSTINGFTQSMLDSKIVLSKEDVNSSITYTVKLHNNSDSMYVFDGVKYTEEFYDNEGITFSLDGLSIDDMIPANGNLTFTITFSYKDNVIPDNNILNSYLNFHFIDISAENCKVEVSDSEIDVYNAGINTLSATITNNNKYTIKGNITFNGAVLDTFEIASKESQTKSKLTLADKISGLAAKDGYALAVNITSPCSKKIENVKVNVKGTITNIAKYGVTVAGTNSDPYLVYAIEDFVRFAQNVSGGTTYGGKYIKQLRNLNFASTDSYYNYADTTVVTGSQIKTAMTSGTGFMGIGNDTNAFSGTYLGNNKSISELYINNTTKGTRVGLFANATDASIQDFGIASGTINANGDGGALVAYIYNGSCNLTNCYNKASFSSSGGHYCVSGLVGVARGATVTIKKCYNTGAVTTESVATGLVGFVWGTTTVTLEECYNTGAITSTDTTSSANTRTAGLVRGDNIEDGKIIISKCYNSGTIKGYSYVGGLVSHVTGTLQITDSYNTGNVTATKTTEGPDASAGGILAYKNSGSGLVTITNVYSTGTTSATSYKGGIIGYNKDEGTTGITCNRAYFKNINSASTTYGGTSMSDANMKLENFVSTLNNGGSNWKYNSGGYPKLSWQ